MSCEATSSLRYLLTSVYTKSMIMHRLKKPRPLPRSGIDHDPEAVVRQLKMEDVERKRRLLERNAELRREFAKDLQRLRELAKTG
jgi:hypothetical protein